MFGWHINKMIKIKNEKELLQKLFLDVDNCKKEKIVFLGGHFPLLYNEDEAIEAFGYWGKFSEYTLELACQVAKYAREKGKEIGFVLFVDDHTYEDVSSLNAQQLSTRRNNLYKARSGNEAKLPEHYKKIMQKFGFSEKDLIRHNHGKKKREDCLYFSEKVLRSSKRKIDNPCAREYVAFLEDKKYFSKDEFYMIAFIPQRCRENICHFALDLEIKGLSGSHVFLDSMAKLATRKQLYFFGNGVLYRKE